MGLQADHQAIRALPSKGHLKFDTCITFYRSACCVSLDDLHMQSEEGTMY